MSLKVVFEKPTGKILGAQCIGAAGVDKRIDVMATAIRAGMTVYDLEHLELSYAPPFGSAKDPVNMAGFVGTNLSGGYTTYRHYMAEFPAGSVFCGHSACDSIDANDKKVTPVDVF